MWTRPWQPGGSTVPRPLRPSTPEEWASSTIMMQLNFSARSHSAGSGAVSPSIENTPSVISSLWPGPVFGLFAKTLAIGNVLVLENFDGRSRKPAAIDDGGVIQFIGKNQIVFP